MIKKEYIRPEAKEVLLHPVTILAGSEPVDPDSDPIDDENDIASMDLDFSEEG